MIIIPFRLPQISCFTLQQPQPKLLHLYSKQLSQCVDLTPASVPSPSRGKSSPTLLFFTLLPLYYRVLHGFKYSFLVVRYSCPFLAGVLQDLLCLEVYSWCIHGERCTPSPPTLPPSWISPRWLQWAAMGLVLDWPKSLFRFSTHSYGKTQMNFLVNSTNSRIRIWIWFQAFAYFSLQYFQPWSNNPEFFFF